MKKWMVWVFVLAQLTGAGLQIWAIVLRTQSSEKADKIIAELIKTQH
jgi:hypothetical protein